MSEQELISGLQKGDATAFKEIVSLFQDKVYNTALGLVQNTADAEDVAQEVFIQVYKSVGQFKATSALSTWIYRITVNKSYDHLQYKKRKKRFGFIVSLWNEDNKPVYEPVNFVHPGVELDKKEAAGMLFRQIERLPENQKTAFILNKIEDLSYMEIADIMNTTEAAVDSLLSRAKQNLRKYLTDST